MNDRSDSLATDSAVLTNGSGAAAILAAGIGSFTVAFFAMAADKFTSISRLMVFYKPTGPLSGVTTSAILVWLISWVILDRRWHKRTVSLTQVNIAALILLGFSLLFTFPPIADLF